MHPDVAFEYARLERDCYAVVRKMLAKGGMKFLGKMLHTLLQYPDHPWGWHPPFEGELAVGYYEKPKLYTRENYRGVVSPLNFDPEGLTLPKEEKLADICTEAAGKGRQTWVFVQYTGEKNVMPRLQQVLGRRGLKVGILNAAEVDTRERLAWIEAHGRRYDVMLSHPEPVSTGLDLFSKRPGGHNYSTIVFYQTGYKLFDLRQAARRSWRIGQLDECEVYYLYARGTMQHRAMELMGRKLAASMQLEGEFSAEGLAALSSDAGAQLALVKAIADRIDDGQLQRNWSKVQSREGRRGVTLLPFNPLDGGVDEDALAALPGLPDDLLRVALRLARDPVALTAYEARATDAQMAALRAAGLADQSGGLWFLRHNLPTADAIRAWAAEHRPHVAAWRPGGRPGDALLDPDLFRTGVPRPGDPSPLDATPIAFQMAAEAILAQGAGPDPSVEAPAPSGGDGDDDGDFDSWLAAEVDRKQGKPTLKVVRPDAEPAAPTVVVTRTGRGLTRADLAAMFDRIMSGNLLPGGDAWDF